MGNDKLHLRRAAKSDVDILYEWANDAIARQNAFNTYFISYIEHIGWFNKVMEDSNQVQYILMAGDEAIGQIRLTIEDTVAEIDYSISKAARGHGYGRQIIELIKKKAAEDYPHVKKLMGKVKPFNDASYNCFTKNGFEEKYRLLEYNMSSMKRYIVATVKSWNIENFKKLKEKYLQYGFLMINQKEELTQSFLESYQPEYIFFPHWSWMIPREIYENFNCVVFHMTDLPFGRGGSPLQNLLVRGIYHTKVSAIKVCSGVDTGPVYFKEPVDISEGSADEIFRRVSKIVFERIIPRFLNEELIPYEQIGDVISFKRRKPAQSEIPDGLSQRQIYDYIRMLDGEGYPTAFKRCGAGRILFSDAEYKDGVVTAKARFKYDMGDEEDSGGQNE